MSHPPTLRWRGEGRRNNSIMMLYIVEFDSCVLRLKNNSKSTLFHIYHTWITEFLEKGIQSSSRRPPETPVRTASS